MIENLLLYRVMQSEVKGLPQISCAFLYYRYWITVTIPGEQNKNSEKTISEVPEQGTQPRTALVPED